MLPEHARSFRGKAKTIPDQDLFMLPYQSRWVLDKSLLTFMEKSRRIGISYGTAYKKIRIHSKKNCRVDSWISSRDETTAKLFIQDCKLFSRMMKAAADDLGQKVIDKESIYSLKFSNQTEINSVASNPDVFAGKGGNVTLDEFALRKDPRGVYAISSPTIDWGGGMEIISTHRGSANYFNELAKEITEKGNPKRFSHHRVTLQDALDQGFLWKLQTKLPDEDPRLDMNEADYFDYQRSRAPDEETFLQEYMCVPSDDASAFMSYDLIATCTLQPPDGMAVTTEDTIDYAGRKGRIRFLRSYDMATAATLPCQLFLGMDIGRDHDLSVLWLMGRLAGVLFPIAIVEMYSVEFDRQEKELYEMLNLPNLMRCCIDNTGIGRQLGERAQKFYTDYKVELVTFTGPVKEGLAYPLKKVFEDRSMRIPDDDLITADLRAIKKETTDAGNIRFKADRGKNGHADRFWAAALAVHAAGDPTEFSPLTIESRPVGSVYRSRKYPGYYDKSAIQNYR
jgi:phage FluMu gp28-like protein